MFELRDLLNDCNVKPIDKPSDKCLDRAADFLQSLNCPEPVVCFGFPGVCLSWQNEERVFEITVDKQISFIYIDWENKEQEEGILISNKKTNYYIGKVYETN